MTCTTSGLQADETPLDPCRRLRVVVFGECDVGGTAEVVGEFRDLDVLVLTLACHEVGRTRRGGFPMGEDDDNVAVLRGATREPVGVELRAADVIRKVLVDKVGDAHLGRSSHDRRWSTFCPSRP